MDDALHGRLGELLQVGSTIDGTIGHHHALVKVRSMLPTVTSGDVDDLFDGRLVAVVAPIDMNTAALDMRNAWRKSQALRVGRGHEAVEFSHARAIEGIQGPTEGVIVEVPGSHAGRHQSGGGLVLEEARHEGERLVDQSSSFKHHRVDLFSHSEVPPFRILLGGIVEHGANAVCVAHASDQSEVVQDLAAVRGLIGHNYLL